MSKTTVYSIYGEGVKPLYIGVAANVDQRLRTHSEKAWWPDVRRIDTREFDTRSEALAFEESQIKQLSPKWNKVHNRGAAAPRQPIPRVNTRGKRCLVTQAEAAEYLSVSTRTIRNYIARGELTAYRLPGGRSMRLDLDEVDATLKIIPTVGNVEDFR